MKKLIPAILLALFSVNTWAASCGTLSVKEFYIQAERTSGQFSNTVILRLSDENGNWVTCAEKSYAYMENTSQSYDSIVSVLLAAQMAEKNIGLVVDENTTLGSANRIEMIYIDNRN